MLVNKCRIYDEDNMAHSAHYNSISEKKEKINIVGSRIVLQLTKGSRELHMRGS